MAAARPLKEYTMNTQSLRNKLSAISTKELVDELKNRDGVDKHQIGNSATLVVKVDGPAIVLCVVD